MRQQTHAMTGDPLHWTFGTGQKYTNKITPTRYFPHGVPGRWLSSAYVGFSCLMARRRRTLPGQVAFDFGGDFSKPGAAAEVAAFSSGEFMAQGQYGLAKKRQFQRFLDRKKDALARALGVRLGNILACGNTGCVVKADHGRILKLTPSRAEAQFWVFAQGEQRDPGSPAAHGIAHVQSVSEVSSDGDLYYAIVRRDVTPAFRIESLDIFVAPETARRARIKERSIPPEWSLTDLIELSPRLADAAEGAVEAEMEYGLGDVHLGNVGWQGNEIVIYDAHYYSQPSFEGVAEYSINPAVGI